MIEIVTHDLAMGKNHILRTEKRKRGVNATKKDLLPGQYFIH